MKTDVRDARIFFNENRHSDALSIYLDLKKNINSNAFNYNINKCLNRIDERPAKRPTDRIVEIQLQIAGAKALLDINRSSNYLRKLIHESKTNTSKSAITITTKEKSSDLFAIELLNTLPEQPTHPVKKRTKNKIAYILHHSLPYISNGYATRAQGIAEGMRASGLDVVCITRPGFPGDTIRSNPIFQNDNYIDGIRYLHNETPYRSGPQRSKNYFTDAAEKLIARIHEESPCALMVASNYVNAIPAIIAAKATGIPIAYEVRGFWEITEISKSAIFEDTFEYHLKKYLECTTYKSVDKLFTLGKAMRDELTIRGGNPAIIDIIPNACDINKFKPTTKNNDLLAKLSIPKETPIIGYIGSFVQYEGLDLLVEACGRLIKKGLNFKLILIGASQGEVYEKIHTLINRDGLQSHILLPGRIPHNEVSDWYSIIDIAPFPRKSQPVTEIVTPLKPMEAMSMGKCVLVSSVSALAEMVTDDETGFIFEKDSVTDLAQKLEGLLLSEEIREKIGRQARTWISKNRTWESMGHKIKQWVELQQTSNAINQIEKQ